MFPIENCEVIMRKVTNNSLPLIYGFIYTERKLNINHRFIIGWTQKKKLPHESSKLLCNCWVFICIFSKLWLIKWPQTNFHTENLRTLRVPVGSGSHKFLGLQLKLVFISIFLLCEWKYQPRGWTGERVTRIIRNQLPGTMNTKCQFD